MSDLGNQTINLIGLINALRQELEDLRNAARLLNKQAGAAGFLC